MVNPRDQLHGFKETNLSQRFSEKKKSFINQLMEVFCRFNKFNGVGLVEKEKTVQKTIISSTSDKLIGAVCKEVLLYY